jgi:galactoside O-acetyltransferase
MTTSFYSESELKNLGLLSYGQNVLISRYANIYEPHKLSLGNHVRIDDFCILSGSIALGSYVHISAYCALYGKAGISMEDFTGLSPRCTLFSVTDNFDGNHLMSPLTKVEHNQLIQGKIVIKKYSQIGANSVVLPNCVIEEGVAVGAMSLVNNSLEPWTINAGIPAKKIKKRDKGLLIFAKEYE